MFILFDVAAMNNSMDELISLLIVLDRHNQQTSEDLSLCL